MWICGGRVIALKKWLSYLNDRFLIVLRRAKFAKLLWWSTIKLLWSTSPFWWNDKRCVCELTFSLSKLNDPARDPVFSNAAMSNIVVNSDGFCVCVFLYSNFFVVYSKEFFYQSISSAVRKWWMFVKSDLWFDFLFGQCGATNLFFLVQFMRKYI